MGRTEFKLTRADIQWKGGDIQKKVNQKKVQWLSRTGAVIAKIARRSMKKAPKQFTKSGKKKDLTRYGRYKKIKSGKRKGEQRFEKGLHSRPGQPPYYHSNTGVNLRDIVYTKRQELKNTGVLNVHTLTNRAGGKTISKPPAILQEAGGTAKIKGQRKTSQFPARPYITPAGQKGIEYMQKVVKQGIK